MMKDFDKKSKDVNKSNKDKIYPLTLNGLLVCFITVKDETIILRLKTNYNCSKITNYKTKK